LWLSAAAVHLMRDLLTPILRKGDIQNGQRKSETLSGVFASVFAHAGHITKEEAKEISGLADHEFEKAYDKASNIAENVMRHEGEKMDKFLEHFAKEIEQHMEHFGGKLFK